MHQILCAFHKADCYSRSLHKSEKVIKCRVCPKRYNLLQIFTKFLSRTMIKILSTEHKITHVILHYNDQKDVRSLFGGRKSSLLSPE